MYAMSTASTTTSGSRAELTATTASAERRVRVVRLLRPRKAAPAFGFSLRGGREYATGFFISKVDLNSEAHLQGLKVGDQVVSVNGYRVDDAVHAELVHYITSQSRLKIKVRHVGMVPIKEKEHEPLSWQFVSERTSLASDVSSSPTLCHNTEHLADLRLSILVPPRAKLGCGICKGPDWKPGIFAISVMKASGRLELIIREGAGTELVSPESSGYNSSASSAAGERSPAPAAPVIPLAPPAALRRRLASVAEEAADRADRLTMNRMKRRTWDTLEFDWKKDDIHNFDAPSDIEPDYDSPSIPNNPHTYESKSNIKCKTKTEFETTTKISSPRNRTIINLTEDGATIQCSYDNNNPRKNMYATTQTNRDNEKKTIVVEVHHMNTTSCGKTHCNNYNPPSKKEVDEDSTSISSSATLSSAIAEEIERRKLNKKPLPEKETRPCIIKKPNVPKAMDNDQKKHHDALMDEFKKVHRKMFANLESMNREVHNKENQPDNLDRQCSVPIRKADHVSTDFANGKEPLEKREPIRKPPPPPPPPMPISNGHKNGDNNKMDGHHALNPDDTDIIKIPNLRKVATLSRIPTPDYNNKTDFSLKGKNLKEENAEVESLESYKLKNPLNVTPKPPSNYFIKAPNGSATMKKHARPVSVTIGEYANNVGRKEPSKLDFLNGDKTDPRTPDDEPITSRLQSELALTLSRSNLRKKTEALGDGGR
ncbi:jg8150 [Pararge aegeria aegeria]|uniref:Jg8150 protein n=1 Tax=Pararge aegeria aegeria TaxID=348720 RepID=A0A8S4SFL9_9NEOP|nr:jg8150 [Pararge aegeria aegeria]CAH2268141.1 jg8150 [Pararge aegeria aegeria]